MVKDSKMDGKAYMVALVLRRIFERSHETFDPL